MFLFIHIFYSFLFQVRLLSTTGVSRQKDLKHFKAGAEKKDSVDDDHTRGNEIYRMPHPIW